MDSRKTNQNKTQRILLLIILVLGWFALITQFYAMASSSKVSFTETIVRFFSFFTILTNLLVTICCTVMFIGERTPLYNFFQKYETLTAISVYILIVGIIYNALLRRITHAQGIGEIDNEIFHVIIPVLFFVYWLKYVPNQSMKLSCAVVWLVYPVAYMIYTLIRGAITNFYPYPFINAYKLGLMKALVNGLFVLLTFFVLSIFLINLKKIYPKEITAD